MGAGVEREEEGEGERKERIKEGRGMLISHQGLTNFL